MKNCSTWAKENPKTDDTGINEPYGSPRVIRLLRSCAGSLSANQRSAGHGSKNGNRLFRRSGFRVAVGRRDAPEISQKRIDRKGRDPAVSCRTLSQKKALVAPRQTRHPEFIFRRNATSFVLRHSVRPSPGSRFTFLLKKKVVALLWAHEKYHSKSMLAIHRGRRVGTTMDDISPGGGSRRSTESGEGGHVREYSAI